MGKETVNVVQTVNAALSESRFIANTFIYLLLQSNDEGWRFYLRLLYCSNSEYAVLGNTLFILYRLIQHSTFSEQQLFKQVEPTQFRLSENW